MAKTKALNLEVWRSRSLTNNSLRFFDIFNCKLNFQFSTLTFKFCCNSSFLSGSQPIPTKRKEEEKVRLPESIQFTSLTYTWDLTTRLFLFHQLRYCHIDQSARTTFLIVHNSYYLKFYLFF
jgi:hypothetical protein